MTSSWFDLITEQAAAPLARPFAGDEHPQGIPAPPQFFTLQHHLKSSITVL